MKEKGEGREESGEEKKTPHTHNFYINLPNLAMTKNHSLHTSSPQLRSINSFSKIQVDTCAQ